MIENVFASILLVALDTGFILKFYEDTLSSPRLYIQYHVVLQR